MPNAYTKFVTWISRGRRHHGSASAGIGSAPGPSVMAPGDTFQPPWAPPSITWTDAASVAHTGSFAFWAVTGGVEGAYATAQNPPSAVTVGNVDLSATAWYIEGGGSGPGEPGVLIDAFDVTLGTFVDDDFVTVTPDDGAKTLTLAANNDGFVPTAVAEQVLAFAAIHAIPFQDWQVIPAGGEVVNGTTLEAAMSSSAIAFAFYTSRVLKLPRGSERELGTWVSWGVMVDGGGPTGRGPVPPWTGHVRELAAGLALAEAAGVVDARLRGGVLEAAAKQVTIAAQAITRSMQVK